MTSRLETMNGVKWQRYNDGRIDGIGKFSRAIFVLLRVTPLCDDARYVVDRHAPSADKCVRIVEEGTTLEEAMFQAEQYETELDHDEVTARCDGTQPKHSHGLQVGDIVLAGETAHRYHDPDKMFVADIEAPVTTGEDGRRYELVTLRGHISGIGADAKVVLKFDPGWGDEDDDGNPVTEPGRWFRLPVMDGSGGPDDEQAEWSLTASDPSEEESEFRVDRAFDRRMYRGFMLARGVEIS